MAISEVRSRRPEILLPLGSTTIRSSTCIMPLQTPVGVARIRSESRRMLMFPSLAATQPFWNISRPISTMSSRYSRSDFTIREFDCIKRCKPDDSDYQHNRPMYSVFVTYRIGVICRNCGARIDVEGEYIQGLPARQMAAALYQPIGRSFPDLVNVGWQETLACGNPDCRKTHRYDGDDLLLYDSDG